MGLTYYAKKHKAVEDFDVNMAGVDLLGLLHQAAGAEVSASSIGDCPNVRFVQTAAGCHKCAQILRQFSLDEQKKLAKNKLFGGPAKEYLKFVQSWIEFLEKCGGYHTDPPESWFKRREQK